MDQFVQRFIGYLIVLAPIILFAFIVRRYTNVDPCRGCPQADNEWVNCDKRTCPTVKRWRESRGLRHEETAE